MKRAASLLVCVVLAGAFLAGCGMFGDTGFYSAIAEACAKCHMQGQKPSKATLIPKPSEAGVKGPGGAAAPGCPMDCPFVQGR